MTVKMQHRRGTAAQWTAANPVLADGEMGIETDTGQVKCGNGTAAWNALGYLSVALAAGIVNSTHLAASSVTSAKIADGSVTSAKIASGAVGSSQIADGAVATADLADGAVTSAKIADGAIVDGDIAAGAAIAASKIAGTAVVASLVDAKGDLLVATADNTLTRLPVGSDGRVLVTDAAALAGVKWAPQTGQLTGSGSPVGVVTPSFAGQLYADTSGGDLWVATGVSMSSWVPLPDRATLGNLLADDLAVCATTVGTGRNTSIPTTVTPVANGLQVASSSTYVGCFIGSGNVTTWAHAPGSLPVGPVGSPMTFLVEVSSPDMTEESAVSLVFQDAAGASGESASASFTLSASRQTVAVIGAVPAGATRAAVRVRTANAGSGARTMILHTLSWHVGAGGLWVPPGVPVPNLGMWIAESQKSGRACYAWDQINDRPQMIYYDSGWRDCSALLANGWTGSLFLRRVDNTVMLRTSGLSGVGATSDTVAVIPSGFRAEATISAILPATSTDVTPVRAQTVSTGALTMNRALVTGQSCTWSYSTTNPLSVTLPGDAAGTIPSS